MLDKMISGFPGIFRSWSGKKTGRITVFSGKEEFFSSDIPGFQAEDWDHSLTLLIVYGIRKLHTRTYITSAALYVINEAWNIG